MRRATEHNSVAYQPLGEICVLKHGRPISNQTIAEHPGPFPVIGSGQQPRGFISTYNTEHAPLGITWPSMRPTWCEGKYFRGKGNVSCTPKDPELLLPRYLYHLLTELRNELINATSRGGSASSARRGLTEFIIPIPPLGVQQQIATRLDPFMELEVALEAELAAQTRRYRHLRRKLFDFTRLKDDLHIKALGEICRLSVGETLHSKNRHQHGCNQPGMFPVMSSARGIAGYAERWNTDDAPLGIIHSGSPGHLTWCEGKYFRTSANWSCNVIDQTRVRERYLFHLLSHMQPELTSLAYGSYASLRSKYLSEFQVPIPLLKVQTEIIEMLDPGHALIHDQFQGLPGEIAGRKQQLKFLRTEAFKAFLTQATRRQRTGSPTATGSPHTIAHNNFNKAA